MKAWVRHVLEYEGQYLNGPWPGVFEIKLAYNKGIAFGWLQGSGILLAPVALGIAGWAAWHSWKHPRESKWSHTALALLASGALGNLYDRVFHGRVTDMFYFAPINFPVFNIADAAITTAAIMLIISWMREGSMHGKETPESVPADSADFVQEDLQTEN